MHKQINNPDFSCKKSLQRSISVYSALYEKMTKLSAVLSTCSQKELTSLAEEITTLGEQCKNSCSHTFQICSPEMLDDSECLLYNELTEVMRKVQQLNKKLRNSLKSQLSLLKNEIHGISHSKHAMAGYANTLKESGNRAIKQVC